MSPIDVFAHQLSYVAQSIPSDYRYSKTEIISKTTISANEVLIIIRKYGFPGALQMEDEETVNFIK
jgi:hypothetical protein